MKTRIGIFALCVALTLAFGGCAADSPADGAEMLYVNVGALQGPTGLGLVKLMEDAANEETTDLYNFTLAGAPDEITGKLISGELDIASVPANLAAVLYARTEGDAKLLAVNALGVLYLLQNNDEETITGIGDLSGKTVYTTGQGATQEYVLSYLLEQSGAGDAQVIFQSEHAELAALVLEGEVEYALLPQPFVTTVTSKDDSVRIALDITEEWEKATGGNQLTMGCVVVRDAFLQEQPEAVERFLEQLRASVDYTNSNVDEAAALSGKFGVVDEAVAQKAIPYCNIACITGEEMKTSVSAYLEVLHKADPQSVGGGVPDEAFYYLP